MLTSRFADSSRTCIDIDRAARSWSDRGSSHTLILSRLDPKTNPDYDCGVNRTTGVIARPFIHVYSNDPKEAGDANEFLHECFVEPDFGARVILRPRQNEARALGQAFTVFELISSVNPHRLLISADRSRLGSH